MIVEQSEQKQSHADHATAPRTLDTYRIIADHKSGETRAIRIFAEDTGRPLISEEIRELIRKVSGANPLWGTPRIVGELGKLGIKVAKSTVDKYRVRSRKAPSPTWKAFFLKNHVNDLVSIDFCIVPTIRSKLLFVFVVLAHSRRKVLHFNATENPTFQWTAQQIIEAPPGIARRNTSFENRDAIYGGTFQKRIHALRIEQVLSAPRSPWQNPFLERPIGTLRRDCPDHVIVLNDRHLRLIVGRYLDYYHNWRTHLSLIDGRTEPAGGLPMVS